jgi:hypothetical protein
MKFMKLGYISFFALITMLLTVQCSNGGQNDSNEYRILFLHHSTGYVIWKGDTKTLEVKGIQIGEDYAVPKWFKEYNKSNGTSYKISEQNFPKKEPYGWENYPYDYYNIWVKHAGNKPYMDEPTLEMLTKQYKVISFKHCYPVSNIQADKDSADINSDYKSIPNYKLQYIALRDKLHEFPDTKFILWTGAAQVKSAISEDEALRASEFFTWVKDQWDLPGDNIHLWDLYSLEAESGLYFREEYATSSKDSHPNTEFALKAAQLIFNRIIDVIENDGTRTWLTGEKL